MKILLATPEAVPFAKTGGLADVSGALPVALRTLGHDVRIVMPRYKSVSDDRFSLETALDEIVVHFPGNWQVGNLQTAALPGTDVPVYFVNQEGYFDRDGLYGEGGEDYADNYERFAFFSMAVLWALKGLDWRPDVIHCNDWQTAMIPTYLRNLSILRSDPFFQAVRTLYTIHNLAYQGSFDPSILPEIGLDYSIYNIDGVEFYGNANFMKAGIVYAGALSTVSKRYAQEIQTEEFGCGMEGILATRADDLHGIMNGIDYSIWDPETDEHIPATYSADDLSGKAKCKEALQKANELPAAPDIPLIGMISRLDSQKGFDLLEDCLDDIMDLGVQLVLLGTGDPKYHRMLREAAETYPKQLGLNLTFNNAMAHRIEAGADMFLMPSRYEPCGLNQLYSLKYGTIPIVRKTGGLADSITDADARSIRSGKATGFVFEDYTANALFDAVHRATGLFTKKTGQWQTLIHNAMAKDYSWTRSAEEYQTLFRKIAAS